VKTICDEAVCVRHWDFSETSQTVSMFCRDYGMIRGLAKGARRERGAFSGGFDLFTYGEISAIIKPSSDLATLTEWSLSETFPILRQSVTANRSAWYFADLVSRFMHHPEPHPRSWDALVLALRALESGSDTAQTVLRFQWTLLDDLGYRPRVDIANLQEDTVAFDPRGGGVVEDTGSSQHWRVRRETAELLSEIERLGGDVAATADKESVSRANRLLGAWVRELTGRDSVPMRMVFES
jgi:DNA repair protein RecO (recombination protein O)